MAIKKSPVLLKSVKFDKDKHLPKTVEEKLNDDFFILLTAYLGEENGLTVNRLNLQKTLFLTKLELHKEGIEFLNTNFYKYILGPYQKRIQYSIPKLESSSLIRSEDITGNDIVLTNKGVAFLLFTLKELEKTEAFKKYSEAVIKYLSMFSGDNAGKSIDYTHKMTVTKDDGKTTDIHNIEVGEENYFEPKEEVKYKVTLKAPEEAITNLINYESYSLISPK